VTSTRSSRQEGTAATLCSHVLADAQASGSSDLVEREARHLLTSSVVKAEAGIEGGGGGAALGQAMSGEHRSGWGLGSETTRGAA